MRLGLLALGFVALVGGGSHAKAEAQKHRHVSAIAVWTGVRADPFPEVKGGVIIDQAVWQRFWKYANLPGACPKVDFATQVVVVGTHGGWHQLLAGWLLVDERGAAKVEWFGMPERIPGSYGILVFPRAGIKSVNGRTISGDL